MRRLATGIALVATIAVAVPGQAQTSISVSADRLVQLRNEAKTVCLAAFQATDVNAYLTGYVTDHKLTDEETVLFQSFCIMYGNGYVAGRNSKN